MNPRRLIVLLYVVLLTGFGIGAGTLFLDAREEYLQLKQVEAVSRARLAAKQTQLREQQRILDRLRADPAFVEKVLRKRLGYGRPGETIFRFQD